MAPVPFTSAEWRLDCELGRRTLLNTAEPSFVVKLKTGGEDETKATFFEADAAHMQYLEQQLAAAVAEASTVRTSRLLRYIR
mmetsp:Transcript_13756/g.18350  ORF Transcript_13756/g.18350 Transcript_13756/m.18350 type:complete len:82 (+) Transcript_13756:80-325(+)|eukprot:CAMPEP_0197290854 /NCGR_PEP_ID=MMETSP0890-20130614/10265_1 /TAXON_ID=44058 ORGANISM="Aureoumbra lagunensis, Strain CCMP1510" /NCGR_SAMPLE_ID=MMETSP0890 /ASSEMBLY_ACC=CAM_ASM_000533 /LENGTH=81 /DNA_ID=CAMNT_0042763197 /DNA_START=63 /DNA_END=308 /DNA_ORIENTATION=+